MSEQTYILTTGTYVATVGAGGSGRGAANHTASAGIGGDTYINPTSPASIDGADMTVLTRGGGCAGPGGSGSYTTKYFNNEDGGSGAGTSGVTQGSSYTNTPSWGSNSGTAGEGSGGGCGVSYGGSGTFTGGGGAGARTGVAGTNATANTGGGGGGGAGSTYTSGYNGGSGIIIFRYRFQ